jgi:2-polyprenyl-3-methyl-5-hydroxy-6-metoxy-1,4-benzoquinol methylase
MISRLDQEKGMKMGGGGAILAQRQYYDDRWALETYANLLQLERAIAILRGLQMLDMRSPKILDLGCGTGWLSAILGRFGPTTGVELSPVAVAKAQALYPDVRFLAADLTNLQLPDETFDVVVSQEVVEHLENQSGHMDLVARLLRPGGVLILTTPNAWNLAHWSPEDIREWGLQPIENWLKQKQLRSLLAGRFQVLYLRTIVLGHGTRGIFRLVNSVKLAAVLKAFGLLSLYRRAIEQAGFGLHFFVVAKRR